MLSERPRAEGIEPGRSPEGAGKGDARRFLAGRRPRRLSAASGQPGQDGRRPSLRGRSARPAPGDRPPAPDCVTSAYEAAAEAWGWPGWSSRGEPVRSVGGGPAGGGKGAHAANGDNGAIGHAERGSELTLARRSGPSRAFSCRAPGRVFPSVLFQAAPLSRPNPPFSSDSARQKATGKRRSTPTTALAKKSAGATAIFSAAAGHCGGNDDCVNGSGPGRSRPPNARSASAGDC